MVICEGRGKAFSVLVLKQFIKLAIDCNTLQSPCWASGPELGSGDSALSNTASLASQRSQSGEEFGEPGNDQASVRSSMMGVAKEAPLP